MRIHAITLPRANKHGTLEPWTHARLALMVALWLAGRSAREIADQLGGTSKGAVIGQLRRLGYIGRDARSVRRKPGAWAVCSGAHNRRLARRAGR